MTSTSPVDAGAEGPTGPGAGAGGAAAGWAGSFGAGADEEIAVEERVIPEHDVNSSTVTVVEGEDQADAVRAVRQADAASRPRPSSEIVRVVSAHKSVGQRLLEIWEQKELVVNLVRTEIRVKYKNSTLGLMWSMLSPAMTLAIYVLVFQVILKNGIPDFVIFLFSGLLLWNLFQVGVQTATSVIVNNAGLVKRVMFPREILALAAVGSASVYFFFQACVMVIFMVALHWAPAWHLLWLVLVALVPLLVLACALALFLASVNVYLRDVQHLVDVMVAAAWFWACPIVYSYQNSVAPKLAKHGLTWVYFLNPVTPLVMTFQRALYARINAPSTVAPHPIEHLLPTWGWTTYVSMDAAVLALGLVLFYIAMVVFGRLSGNFAEEL